MTDPRQADSWLFPLGHYLGPFHRGRGEPVAHHQLRIGQDTFHLQTEDELAAWLLAHGLAGPPPARPWSRAAVETAILEQADAERTVGVAQAISELLGEGALVEVPDTAATTFATEHRFCPLLVGLGADPRRPEQLIVGLTGNPVVTMDELGFQVWEWAHQYPNLWEACQAFAEVDSRLAGTLGGAGDGAAATPQLLLPQVLRRVHRLLAYGAGYLDPAS